MAAGFLDLNKSVYANWDPGLPAKNQKDLFYNNNDAFPEELTGVVLGFEPTDGVVEIKSVKADNKLQNELFIIYGHDNSINHAYVAEDNKIKGTIYKEIDRNALYERFGINNGTTKESLRWVAQKAEEYFSEYTPRSALKAVLRIARENDKSVISNDAMYFAVRAMLKAAENLFLAKRSNPSDPLLSSVFSDAQNMKRLQEINAYLLKQNLIGINGGGKPIVRSYDDKEGKLQEFMTELRTAVGKYKDEIADTIEAEVNTTAMASYKKSAKTISDLKTLAEIFRGTDPFPPHYNASMNEDPTFAEDEGYDVRVCQFIQNTYDQMQEHEAKGFAEDVIRELNKPFRNDRTKEKKGMLKILGQIVRADDSIPSLAESPVNTVKNDIEINLDNVQSVCARIQSLYDGAENDAKKEFTAEISKRISDKENPSKVESDITEILSRVTAAKKGDRLDQNPIMADTLVVEPTASFFDLYSRIGDEFERLNSKRNETGELSLEDKSYEDHLKIIEKIAKNGGLDDKVVSSKIGGWMTMFDPQIEEVVIHDMSVVTRSSGFETYKGFTKESVAVAIQKAIKEIEFSPNSVPQKSTLIATQIQPAEVDRLMKEPVSSILKFLQEYAISYGRDILSELNRIDRQKGFGPSHENPFEDIISEYEQMEPAERSKKGDRFLQSLVMVDRGVRRATTRQLSTPSLTKNDSRPRIDGGIPRSIAIELMGGVRNSQRYDLAPTEEYFTVATFRKAINVTNKGGEEVGIKASAAYSIDSIIGRHRAYIAPVNSTFVERIAFALQEFNQADENGVITFTRKGDGGEDVPDQKNVAFTKLIEFLQKVTKEFADGSKANGKTDLVNEMNKAFGKAKIAYDRALEKGGEPEALKAGMKIVHDAIKEGVANNTDFGILMKAVEHVNQNRLLKSFDLSRFGRKNKRQVDEYVKAIRAGMKNNDHTDLRYMTIDKDDYKDDAEISKARKSLASLQYSIAERLAIGKYAVEVLSKQGLDVAMEQNLSVEGKNTVRFSGAYSESRDVMNVLRNQLYMANVGGNGFNGVHANPMNPYVQEVEEEFPGGKIKSLQPKADFAKIMKDKCQSFDRKETTQWLVDLLKKGHETNKAPIEDYSQAFNLFAAPQADENVSIPETAVVATEMNPTIFMVEPEEVKTAQEIVEEKSVSPVPESEIGEEEAPVIMEHKVESLFPSIDDLDGIDDDYDLDDLTMSDIESLSSHIQQRHTYFEDIGTEWSETRTNGPMIGGTSH
ncbi:MAG: hypothetical protein PHT07_10015 [Paludibacter sp.]|nr:hypothetical protein [Paludibacter sp.]